MLVKEYLADNGISADELGARLGVKVQTVERKVRGSDEMPRRWARELGLELEPDAAGGGAPDEPGLAGNGAGRDHETPPTRPQGARVRPPEVPAGFDASSFAKMIAGVYSTAGGMVSSSDPFLGAAVIDHADAAGDAWAKWAAQNPRVVAWLERMMIGTPLGEVIGVHVAIGFAYFLARSEHSRSIRDAASAAAAAAGGTDEPAPAAEWWEPVPGAA